jgi:hypothetical protein
MPLLAARKLLSLIHYAPANLLEWHVMRILFAAPPTPKKGGQG